MPENKQQHRLSILWFLSADSKMRRCACGCRSCKAVDLFRKSSLSTAIIYSIVETAKESGLNPYAYFNHLFERLPNLDSRDPETLDQLLPWNVKLP
jgi:hypothetical protein